MKKNTLRIGLLVGLIILQIMFFVIMNQVSNINDAIVFFDMNPFLSKTEMSSIINQINQSVELRQLVTRFYIVDAVFPFVYATLIGSFLWYFRNRNIIYIIMVGAVLDFLENTFVLNALTEDVVTNTIFYGLKIVTPLKFVFILVSIIIVVVFYRKELNHENDSTSD
jgi:cAMP phosphodiesterase